VTVRDVKVKVLIGSVVALLLVGVGLSVAYIAHLHRKELRYKTQDTLLRAMPATATAELQARGYPLSAPLQCRSMPDATRKKMRVACTGSSPKAKLIQVIGAAETKVQEQYFTILVNGRPLVQNVSCLGADCHPKD
jgi:hypothetical protein